MVRIKWRGRVMLALALLLFVAANTRLCCAVVVGGERLDGLYSPLAVTVAEFAAQHAAEEITSTDTRAAQCTRVYTLSVSAPRGDAKTVSDALLRASSGVGEGCGVYANGEALGYVDSGAILLEWLHRSFYSTLPFDAGTAQPDVAIKLERGYTRSENICTYPEMTERVLNAKLMY